jgi:hypothetical protein
MTKIPVNQLPIENVNTPILIETPSEYEKTFTKAEFGTMNNSAGSAICFAAAWRKAKNLCRKPL